MSGLLGNMALQVQLKPMEGIGDEIYFKMPQPPTQGWGELTGDGNQSTVPSVLYRTGRQESKEVAY